MVEYFRNSALNILYLGSSIGVLLLEVTWVVTLFLQLCVRSESRIFRYWSTATWLVEGWKRSLVYGPLGALPLVYPHNLWLSYVAGGQLIALSLFHIALSFKGRIRRRRKRKERLLNGDIDSFESSRFEEVTTEVLDDGLLPEPIPGSSHSLSDSLGMEQDTVLEI